jgi:hypothetical protein
MVNTAKDFKTTLSSIKQAIVIVNLIQQGTYLIGFFHYAKVLGSPNVATIQWCLDQHLLAPIPTVD